MTTEPEPIGDDMSEGMDLDALNSLIDGEEPTRATGTISLCLRGDLVAQWEDLLRRRATLVANAPSDSLASGSDLIEITEQMEALREQMKASTTVFYLQALPRKQFRALVDDHPPRILENGSLHPEDSIGVNTAVFFDPAIRRSLIKPKLDPKRLTKLLEERLSDGQYEELANKIWALNRGGVSLPFSFAVSRQTPASESE